MRAIARLADELAPYGPPIVVFNKSHSGSRLLARVLKSAGVFVGANCNKSEDSLDVLRIVESAVERHYPAYAGLFDEGDPQLLDLVRDALDRHLSGMPTGARWGWKLCESGYALPLFARLFPGGWFVHLLRDGRDVAFSDHVAPTTPFWRKIFFDTAGVERWHGRALTSPAYRRKPHVYNAQHWVNSVRVGRAYGAMLAPRYREVRYEALCRDFAGTTGALLQWLELEAGEPTRQLASIVCTDRIGKHRDQPARRIAEAVAVLDPWLLAFGYADAAEIRSAMRWWQSLRVG